MGYLFTEIRIRNHNSKASIYFGIHQLKNYNNSTNFKVEILPNNTYLIFNDQDTITHGEWGLSVSKDNSNMLLLNGKIFGIGDLEVNNPSSVDSPR